MEFSRAGIWPDDGIIAVIMTREIVGGDSWNIKLHFGALEEIPLISILDNNFLGICSRSLK